MSYPNKKQKPCKTPFGKGVLNYCPSCVYYIHQEPDQPKIKYPCRKSHQQVRKAAGINYARDFRDCALYEKVILQPDINYITQRIMSIEERQQVIREYLDIEKVNVPFLVEILPHKYVEKYKVEKWVEDKIKYDKDIWKVGAIYLVVFLLVAYIVEHIN